MLTNQPKNDVTGLWDYSKINDPCPYPVKGSDFSYLVGMRLLAGCAIIEDWGCGTAYAKRFCPPRSLYVGVDGSPSQFAEKTVDLRNYHSNPDGIFMRHVLEHNLDWREVLRCAIESFTKAMCIILFIPLGENEKVGHVFDSGIPDIILGRSDFLGMFSGLFVQEIHLQETMEQIFYIARKHT